MKTKVYREDDWVAEVEILEDNSTDEAESYKVKVIGTIQQSKMYKPTPDGHIFEPYKLRKGTWGGNWSLV